MNDRFKIAVAVALLILGSTFVSAQSRDILGWQGTSWGMSQRDLEDLFGSRLQKLPKREAFFWRHVDYVIPEFLLDGNTYTVFFQMDDRTNKLDQVLIRLNEMETRNPREEEFNRLDRLLTKEFGNSTEKSDEKHSEPLVKYRSMYRSRTWKFPSSTIELYYGWDNQIYASLLSIRYFAPEHASTATPNNSLDRR